MRRLGESGYGCVLFVTGLLLAACSSEGEPSGSSTGGAGGSGASAGSGGAGGASAGSGGGSADGAGGTAGSSGTGGAGGSGGTYSFGPSLTGSCMAYVFESCKRQAECKGGYATRCIELTFECPDIAASVGSTRTAESLRACAEEYAAFPCDRINAGEIPSCVTPGTRRAGEPCLFNSQCASLSCSAEDQQCGTCDALVGENEDCSTTGVACDLALVCSPTSQACVKPEVTTPEELAEEGESCTSGPDCAFNLDCDSNTDTCVPYPTLGMSCEGPRSCDFTDGSYCELDGLTCKAPPALGQPCGVDGWTGTAGACADDTRCHKTSAAVGICEALAPVGSPCFTDPETQEPDPYSCVDDAYCDARVSPALCAARLDAGENCGAGGACKSGLSCLCESNDPACSSKVCGKLKIDSQSCSEPGDICHPGFSCTGGVCVPKDSQGLYDAVCQ